MFSDQGELEIVHCLTLTLEKDSFFSLYPRLDTEEGVLFFSKSHSDKVWDINLVCDKYQCFDLENV